MHIIYIYLKTTKKKQFLDKKIVCIVFSCLQSIAWVTVSGLFTLGLAVIGIVCAEAGHSYLLCFCVVYLLGEAAGSLFLLKDLSVCRVYQATNCLADKELQ